SVCGQNDRRKGNHGATSPRRREESERIDETKKRFGCFQSSWKIGGLFIQRCGNQRTFHRRGGLGGRFGQIRTRPSFPSDTAAARKNIERGKSAPRPYFVKRRSAHDDHGDRYGNRRRFRYFKSPLP